MNKYGDYIIAPLPNGADRRKIIAESIEDAVQECYEIWTAWGKGIPKGISAICLNTLQSLEIEFSENGKISKIINGKIKDKGEKCIWKRKTLNIPEDAEE